MSMNEKGDVSAKRYRYLLIALEKQGGLRKAILRNFWEQAHG